MLYAREEAEVGKYLRVGSWVNTSRRLVPLSYVGDGFPYPTTSWPTWPDRQAIPGAVIKSHQELNLFFGITRTAAGRVQAGAPVITYTAGGDTYTLQTHWAYVLLAPHTRCPSLP